MKIVKVIFALLFSIILLAGCSAPKGNLKEAQVQKISPKEAKGRLDSDSKIILLDVRTEEEYKNEHIPNSTLLPLDSIEDEAETKIQNKDAVIFVYCRSGNRSAAASKTLVKMGYTNVYDMGGITNWPYETQSGL